MGHYRIEFSKGPKTRFISHLELMHAFARALRRAQIPLAFSEGFNPHPKMSFASAVAVGMLSDKEYLDLELREEMSAGEILARLKASLPPGLDVRECKELKHKTQALMAMVDTAQYEVKTKLKAEVAKKEIDEAIVQMLQKDHLIIEKHGKRGLENKDIRPGIYALSCKHCDPSAAYFEMVVQAGSKGNIRPEEVMQGLSKIALLPVETEAAVIKRTGLFISRQGQLLSPLELND